MSDVPWTSQGMPDGDSLNIDPYGSKPRVHSLNLPKGHEVFLKGGTSRSNLPTLYDPPSERFRFM